MSDRKIPITNVYYLLCYAWGHIEEGDPLRLEHIDGLNSICDLLGHVLALGTFRLLRRGLDQGYREVREDLAGVRGKVNVGESVKRALRSRGRVGCEFAELSHDVLHNQIVRSTLQLLLRVQDLDSRVRSTVRQAHTKLADVSEIEISRGTFQLVQLDRNRRFYRFLLSVCQLIVQQLLVNESTGSATFVDFSNKSMEKLYEEFIIAFYRREQEHFQVNHSGRRIEWVIDGTASQNTTFVPKMEADVILEAPDRRIIMDAKFYLKALTDRFGKKLRSEHLYQLLAYLRNREAKAAYGPKHEGMLLYPTVDDSINIDVYLEGFSVQVRSINLAQQWKAIHSDMLELIE